MLSDRPVITRSIAWLWEAFLILSSSRLRGFGPQPIQCSEIVAYCDLHELDGEDKKYLFRCVTDMDVVWMNRANKQGKE